MATSEVVFRWRASDGEFRFRLAPMSREDAQRLNPELVASPGGSHRLPGGELLGPPLDLAQAMDRIGSRDFTVLDVTA